MPSASKILGDLVSSSGALSVTNTAITGTITTAQIANSAITTDKVAAGGILTSDIADGNVTDAKIVSVANTKITGVLTASQLANTNVTAGVYGGSSNSALITVDAQGRITSASNVAAAGGVTSLNGQTGAIDNTTAYAIGSYVIGKPQGSSGLPTFVNNAVNATVAGSSLFAMPTAAKFGAPYKTNESAPGWDVNGTQVIVNTGSWRCTSPCAGTGDTSSGFASPGLWVRYA